jgi:arginase
LRNTRVKSFRHAGLIDSLRDRGLEVRDSGDLDHVEFKLDAENPKQQNLALVCDVARRVAEQVSAAAEDRARVIVIGGDCTITLGVLAGLIPHAPNLGLLYFDGDVDLNTPSTTTSGIFDGMVMSHITGGGAEALARIGPRHPLISEEKIVLFGYNVEAGCIDPPEIEKLAKSSMLQYPVPEIRENLEHVAIEALTRLESQVDRVLVHFDVDVMDHRDFPAADVLHEHGLSFDDAMAVLRIFTSSPKFAGLVITEFNSDRDEDGSLARRLVDALVRILANAERSWGATVLP